MFTWNHRDKRTSSSTPPQLRSSREFPLSPLLAAHTKNAPVSLFVTALTKTKDLKSFACRTYKKNRGGLLSFFRPSRLVALAVLALVSAAASAIPTPSQPVQSSASQAARLQWKTVPFAIVRYNDDAPKSWNVYHGEKKGVYLVRLWKRYLLIDTTQQAVFEIDPAKVKAEGENAELSPADVPADPIDTSEWKSRDAGPVLRHRFRFGTTGNFVELQIPLQINGKPAY